ncbi:MAG: hypothetical protein AB1333_04075 [Patescibacteria group bacterium]
MKEIFIWILVSCQMIVWVFFTYKKGKLNDKQFYIFTICLLLGQIGSAIDSYGVAWAAFAVQIYFFIFTFYGGLKRYLSARNTTKNTDMIGFDSIDELFGYVRAFGYKNEKKLEFMETFIEKEMKAELIQLQGKYYFEPIQ